MTEPIPLSRVQRVRHELKRRELTVVRVAPTSPHFRRITFTSDSLVDFISASFDDHLKLILDTGRGEPAMRDYTPRRFDTAARELDIEFALHGDGPAANWAAQAAPGQRVMIGGPRGSFIVPTDYAWHLLIGDDTALPAVARRLEELPAGTRAIVRMVVADTKDRRLPASAAAVEVEWFDSTDALLASIRALTLPAGEGYAWCAGEAAATAELRRVLVDEKGHSRHAIRAAAYWKRGAIAHHESLDG
ncbi:MAG: siderophore-interacting protein [Burkholderiales bacterium]